MSDSNNNDAKRAGIISTVIVHVIVILACVFCALHTPLPLPGEEGVEVMLGNNDAGKANDFFYEQPNHIPEVSQPPQQKQEESVLTSKSEEEVFMPEEKQKADKPEEKEKPVEQQKTVVEPVQEPEPEPDPEPVVNPNAMYKGSSSQKSSNNASGTSGNEGSAGSSLGNPNSNNPSGLGGSGNGISFSLDGRSSVSLPKPEYSSQEQGKIVVEIHVNKKGDVIKAVAGKAGTTISDQDLWNRAENAAKKTKFSPDPRASEIQIGTITYIFRRINE
ncbi:MAG: hypothetical protein PHU62_09080 [Bacteroidales bacterium]|jgi:periplasmic protein TonB|nr:hypothetical protein [Bacteroidales bacterium]MDD2205398.1 hypothetical protein [Bacteroidales bacterium]MDD3152649.1 hypothetical protein [Bacteroidales bacterium]MDD3914800.1 hypothetical protein [Bacteroidales bacterium]MDD4634703.1 hypothetical protein [Bacteroidales bacterium]